MGAAQTPFTKPFKRCSTFFSLSTQHLQAKPFACSQARYANVGMRGTTIGIVSTPCMPMRTLLHPTEYCCMLQEEHSLYDAAKCLSCLSLEKPEPSVKHYAHCRSSWWSREGWTPCKAS